MGAEHMLVLKGIAETPSVWQSLDNLHGKIC